MPIDSPALLAADQADKVIRLFNPFAAGDRKPDLWRYPAEGEPACKYLPTDAKRVEIDGVTHVLAAYHGRVRLIRFDDHKVIQDYSAYQSCHSAERLPDGALVTANSNHGKLTLHRSADDYTDLDLPYAHGVTWDKSDGVLWALGDVLYRINYKAGALTIDKTFKMPLTPTGHRKQAAIGEAAKRWFAKDPEATRAWIATLDSDYLIRAAEAGIADQ